MPTVNLQVGAGADDCGIDNDSGSSGYSNSATQDEVRSQAADPDRMSFRFDPVAIPAGATITAATFEARISDNTGRDDVYCDCQLEDADDPAAPTDGTDFAARVMTSASTLWDETSVPTESFQGPGDLSDEVQEVVDRVGWATGQAMQVFLSGRTDETRRLEIDTYDNDSAHGATFDITYTEAAGGAVGRGLTRSLKLGRVSLV